MLESVAVRLLLAVPLAGCSGPPDTAHSPDETRAAPAVDAAAPAPGGAASRANEVADTPRALVERLRAAETEERYGDALAEVLPDRRELLAYICWFDAAYVSIGAEPEVVAEYEEIVARHGLDPSWLNRRPEGRDVRGLAVEALRGVPLPALFADLARFRVAHGRFGVALGFCEELHELELDADGVHAYATVGKTRHVLQREGDRWYWRALPSSD